jgi:hypothetical protein
MLLFHILIALSSLAYATYAVVAPSQTKLNGTYGLLAATLVTGTYLAVSSPVHILQTCMTGLAYCGVMVVGITSTRMRLSAQKDS